MSYDQYQNPLNSRYASREMSQLWSPRRKFVTWRRLWVALAEAEAELGLEISPTQLQQLRDQVENIDFAAAEAYERKLRHDVMAHVHAYGDVCPDARPIIHLGATSCYVTDNTDLILMREAAAARPRSTRGRPAGTGRFCQINIASSPCLAFTHLQPAQPTTVGKRCTLWMQDLLLDLDEIEHRLTTLRARSVKGTTGTQASFLQLFDGDSPKGRTAGATGRPRSWGSIRLRGDRADLSAQGGQLRRSTSCRGSPKALTRRPPTCGCWPIARRSRNRSRCIRSARPRWPTSGIRCGASGSAGSHDS